SVVGPIFLQVDEAVPIRVPAVAFRPQTIVHFVESEQSSSLDVQFAELGFRPLAKSKFDRTGRLTAGGWRLRENPMLVRLLARSAGLVRLRYGNISGLRLRRSVRRCGGNSRSDGEELLPGDLPVRIRKSFRDQVVNELLLGVLDVRAPPDVGVAGQLMPAL